MNFIVLIGKYFFFFLSVFTKPVRRNIFWRRVLDEIELVGVHSIWIIGIVSVFMGAVLALQVSINFESPLIPKYLVGYSTRETIILEFSSTIICLILAGKVGSNIASEIGTMRISEQIDALDIMGINSANYLILPKIIAGVLSFPILTLLSMILGICGGYLVAILTNVVTLYDYIYGITAFFVPYYVFYALVKMVTYSIIITSVSSFYGYYTSGGALEVGKSSTDAVVSSIILILIFNLLLTQLLLI
jgi:phospholipid/cholesterol/gamma-HCH transport system permease protein